MLKSRTLLLRAMALCLGLALTSAWAQDGPTFKFSGFGTFGGVVTNNDTVKFRAEYRQGDGASGHSPDFGVDSKLGLQANVVFNETFSAVGQVLATRRETDTPEVEWLYAQGKSPWGLTLKLGRMVLPTFLISDSRSVGYAVHWVRAPSEVYSQYAATYFDGGQLQYNETFGAYNLTVQVSKGSAEERARFRGPSFATVKFPDLLSLNILVESGNWLGRYGRTSNDRTQIVGATPPLTDVFSGVGLQYDNAETVVIGEFTQRREKNPALFDSDGWYVSAGQRFGEWLPYASVSKFKMIGFGYGGLPAESTHAIGVRWDFMKNVAAKAQFETVKAGARVFLDTTPAFVANPPKVRVLSAVVDFVF